MKQIELIQTLVTDFFKHIQIDPPVVINEAPESIEVFITGDNLNFLIGTHGLGLSALESFLNTVSFRHVPESLHVSVDINDYKVQKTEKIQDMARRAIDKVRFFGEEVILPPMTPSERRMVHTFVTEYDDVLTESSGDEPFRRVVLKKKQ